MGKILFYQWNAFMQKGIERALRNLKIDYEVYYAIPKDWDYDDEFKRKFRHKIDGNNYLAVLSINFLPLISDICEEKKIKYISWIYDSPIHIRRIGTLKNKCNIIYFFDRIQSEKYNKIGVNGARYMPLASDPEVFGMGQLRENSRYESDVTFLGQLYKSEYYDIVAGLNQYNRGYLEAIISAQIALSQGFIIDDMLEHKIMNSINADFVKASQGEYSVTKEELSYTLAKEVTGRQRKMALLLLQSRFNVDVYSIDKSSELDKVNYKGYADYYTRMPQVFARSKINLNISLCTIESGIPLRILDIMACGGFVISNPQPEIYEYFVPGQDIEVYEDMTDLVRKVRYYLTHDDEREKIARNGYKKVCSAFNYKDRLQIMLGEISE